MFKTKTKDIFTVFSRIRNILDLDGELSEIAVNQNQIIFECSNIIEFHKFNALRVLMGIDPNDITTFENKLFVAYRGILDNNEEITSEPKLLMNTIQEVSNYVCKCPILEMRISNEYIKVYLDKPNIKISDIIKLDEIFSSEGVLQTGEQRAYVLYVND